MPIAPRAAYPGGGAVSAPARTPTAAATAVEPQRSDDDDTPWGFFRKNVTHADSLGKWLALIFFTMALAYFYLPRFVIGSVIVVGALALVKPQVRDSRLVRIGFVLSLLGYVALVVAGRFNDNPLGFGLLFSFTTPLGAAMMVLGAVHVLLLGAMRAILKKTDSPLNRDIASLVASAGSSHPFWPDEPPLPEVDRVATHGSRAGSALVALLGDERGDRSGANHRDVHVEQQAALALCKIYGVLPTVGETVRDARSPEDDSQVRGFWRTKLSGL